jgi:hypothetical protein
MDLITNAFITNLINTKIRPLIQKVMVEINLEKSSLAKQVDVTYDNTDYELVISMPDYAKVIDSGRKPGSKPPPIRAILKWIQEKQINSGNSSRESPEKKPITDEQLAFAISNAIGEKGITAKPFIERLQDLVVVILKENITKELKEQMINQLKTK